MKKQAGFTLIELVVVMVILGIMAAVALPKFVDMSSQARIAKMQGAVGAVQSSVTLIHASWLAGGSGTTAAYEGGTLSSTASPSELVNGYPSATAYLISGKNIAGLDANFTTNVASGVVTIADNTKATCSFTLTNSTAPATPPVVAQGSLIATNC